MTASGQPSTDGTIAATGSDMRCRICGGAVGSSLILQELMYGTREEFEYWRCELCGSLQIGVVPDDLSRHYPPDYYSFRTKGLGLRRTSWLVLAGSAHRFGRHLLRSQDKLWDVLSLLPPSGGQVIDIGAGNAPLLRQLRFFGYDCLAVDPYRDREGRHGGVLFRRCHISDIDGQFDLVMLVHSLEHMADPNSAFAHIRRLLGQDGAVLLVLPVIPNNVWDEFGIWWPQLDAPRHLYTFTLKALEGLATKHGMTIRDARYVARPWSRSIARAYRAGSTLAELSDAQWYGSHQDHEETRRANEEGRGDQVRLVLVHSTQQGSELAAGS